MKYRSYNSEILIATTMLVDVFNDIIIDRRTHGSKLDYKKGITLKDIVQQKIEVPCIVGDRGVIFRSLENETGAYRLPLIIMEMSGMKTDSARFADIHADVFLQPDDRFATLDHSDIHYKPQVLSKRRGQPVDISFKVTFVTKYREDLDQILSNFIVHFRPDIYLRWWHPRIKTAPLDMQILWDHSVSYESVSNYDPKNIFKYTATCSFTMKTWLFYGLLANDNTPEEEDLILKVKIFTGDQWDVTMPSTTLVDGKTAVELSQFNEDEMWVFGDLISTPSGLVTTPTKDLTMGRFHGAGTGDDLQELAALTIQSGFELDSDTIHVQDWLHGKNNGHYQPYLTMTDVMDVGTLPNGDEPFVPSEIASGIAHFKNVYYYGSYPNSAYISTYVVTGYADDTNSTVTSEIRKVVAKDPSGDFMFNMFYSDVAEFGGCYMEQAPMRVAYAVDTRKLIFATKKETANNSYYARSEFISNVGAYQELSISSQLLSGGFEFHKEFNERFELIEDPTKSFVKSKNIKLLEQINPDAVKLEIENPNIVNRRLELLSMLRSRKKYIDLVEKKNHTFDITVMNKEHTKVDTNFRKEIKEFEEKHEVANSFKGYKLLLDFTENGKQYQLYFNSWMYIVIEIDGDEADVYDMGLHFPLKYKDFNAQVYLIEMPKSRELLGFNMYVGI